jgi:hypothetical protein
MYASRKTRVLAAIVLSMLMVIGRSVFVALLFVCCCRLSIIRLPAEAEGVGDREGSVSAAAVSLWLGSGIDWLFNRRISSGNSASATV